MHSFQNWGSLCSMQELLTQYSSQRLHRSQSQAEGTSLTRFYDLVVRLQCSANKRDSCHSKQRFAECTGFPSLTGKLVQAACFRYSLCKGSCWLHTVLLHKLDTTDDSCPVLPVRLTSRRYRIPRLLHAVNQVNNHHGIFLTYPV